VDDDELVTNDWRVIAGELQIDTGEIDIAGDGELVVEVDARASPWSSRRTIHDDCQIRSTGKGERAGRSRRDVGPSGSRSDAGNRSRGQLHIAAARVE